MKRTIIRTLIRKEAARLAGQRSAWAVAGLLIAAAFLMRWSVPEPFRSQNVRTCWVDYWRDGPWIDYLRNHIPMQLRDQIRFRSVNDIPMDRHGTLQYDHDDMSIQIRPLSSLGDQQRIKVWFWQPGNDVDPIEPFEDWFWRESEPFTADSTLHIEVEHSSLQGLGIRGVATMSLVLFAVFLFCVCILPAVTCEEKEHGMLAAQALSPATAAQAIVAKAILYLPIASGLALVLACVSGRNSNLTLLAAGIAVSALTAFGLGLAIAALATTQRSAGSYAMCYALAATIVMALCRRSAVPFLADWMVESRLTSILGTAMETTSVALPWHELVVAVALACGWVAVGGLLFSRCWRYVGWRYAWSREARHSVSSDCTA